MAVMKKRVAPAPFKRACTFVDSVQLLVFEKVTPKDWGAKCHAALNGRAGEEVRKSASLKVRRKYGAFFTGTELGKKLLALRTKDGTSDGCYDPSCGMGDLLLARARNLPLGKTLENTLVTWGRRISGTDLHPEFVEGARKRLMLLARSRHGLNGGVPDAEADYFPHLRVADGLGMEAAIKRAKLILMNPPFGVVKAPKNCEWAGGKITQAAIFVAKALERAKVGTELLAILPEVLRSGSFSEKWRHHIGKLADVCEVKSYGIFDKSADVDVFLLRLIRRNVNDHENRLTWPSLTPKKSKTVSDFFDVHVGRVVPHRDKKKGLRNPYIHARCVPVWSVMKEFSESRKHSGLPFKPPFVVVRRTSRPEHQHRASATVISGQAPVFVENHLIVCQPKDGKLRTCRKLMAKLKKTGTTEFLNARIRCRHLTVGAVAAIPFYG